MTGRQRLLVISALILFARPLAACEPVLPFMQVMIPAATLSGSFLVLVAAIALKAVLFASFEQELPRFQAAWLMVIGNILTSFIGLLVAVLIASTPLTWVIGFPVVAFICWLPARGLVQEAPVAWIGRQSPFKIAAAMTCAFVLSCILFIAGSISLEVRHLALYWIFKFAAIFFALLASVTLTTIWEEWVIWKSSALLGSPRFFPSVLRANLYTLLFVMLVPAILILPKRLHNPDFLGHHHHTAVTQTVAATR